jgi:hypothetical protein
MKFNKISLTIIVLLLSTPVANAASIYIPPEVLQGGTLELHVPKDDITDINGTFDGKNIVFFEVEKVPNWDEKINRGEFLQLMFTNHDFGEIDTSTATEFPDVSATNPYYEYIQKASALDIIHGYEDGKFRPYTSITRGQITKILVRAFDPQTSTEEEVQTFEDVPEDHRFYEYINRSVLAGYFQGYPDGFMRPDRNINYSEAEIVITRAASPENFIRIGEKPYFKAFIGVHRSTGVGTKLLNLNIGTEEIEVFEREVPVISFTLPETKTELLGKEQQDNTWAMINAAKGDPIGEQLWEGEFIVPAEGVITLGYGDKLYINGVFSGSHFGIDYANEEGINIYASNSGKVTLADATMSYGNTVIIDHGFNVYTMYLHMSELKVEKDQYVEKGELIGLMGATGVATGPHLHFTHFIGDIIVCSDVWFDGKY